ncbi:aspartate/glutamate racemase family protein [Aliisedimentitalea scapharcae]|uniref:Aspartate/glutamate racemase family protein n=1 Tax=Aliisedimentitalea scapharcae TaxID=1524259 RepID=A0ABZ2XW80_9RHOB
MKKIGILGGVGWASTLDYYRAIAQGASRRAAAHGHTAPVPIPPMTIESVVQAQTRALRGSLGDELSWAAFDTVFRTALLTLQGAGCDFAIIASNTPHARLHAITRGVTLPVLSIYEATATATKRGTAATGANAALVLGTTVTMQSDSYAHHLAAAGIAANAQLPDPDIAEMQSMIDDDFHGISNGDAAPKARARLLRVCNRHATPGTAIILACTELPLAFPDHLDDVSFHADGHLFINPSAAHVQSALDRALGDDRTP